MTSPEPGATTQQPATTEAAPTPARSAYDRLVDVMRGLPSDMGDMERVLGDQTTIKFSGSGMTPEATRNLNFEFVTVTVIPARADGTPDPRKKVIFMVDKHRYGAPDDTLGRLEIPFFETVSIGDHTLSSTSRRNFPMPEDPKGRTLPNAHARIFADWVEQMMDPGINRYIDPPVTISHSEPAAAPAITPAQPE